MRPETVNCHIPGLQNKRQATVIGIHFATQSDDAVLVFARQLRLWVINNLGGDLDVLPKLAPLFASDQSGLKSLTSGLKQLTRTSRKEMDFLWVFWNGKGILHPHIALATRKGIRVITWPC